MNMSPDNIHKVSYQKDLDLDYSYINYFIKKMLPAFLVILGLHLGNFSHNYLSLLETLTVVYLAYYNCLYLFHLINKKKSIDHIKEILYENGYFLKVDELDTKQNQSLFGIYASKDHKSFYLKNVNYDDKELILYEITDA